MRFLFSLFVFTLAVVGFLAIFSVKYGKWYLCVSPREYVVKAFEERVSETQLKGKIEEKVKYKVLELKTGRNEELHITEDEDLIERIIEKDMRGQR